MHKLLLPVSILHLLLLEFKKILQADFVRKFMIVYPPLVGCCRSQWEFNATGDCRNNMNKFPRMVPLTQCLWQMSSELNDFKYSLGNLYVMVVDFFQNTHVFGFAELESL